MIDIRHAKPEDASAISDLIHRLAPYCTIEPDGKGAEQFFASISDESIASYIRSPNFAYFVATLNDQLIGVAALRDSSHVYHLFIASEFHGKGYGRILWEHLRHHAQQLGPITRFTVNSSSYAEQMYRHFGFTPTSEKQIMHGLAFVPMEILIKEP